MQVVSSARLGFWTLAWRHAVSYGSRSDQPGDGGRTASHVLLCKRWRRAPLRDAAEASTMVVFSFGLVPAQAFRAQ